MTDLFSVKGKVAVVTGGSRGIGAMIAKALVENGAKTYITSRKEADCQETANRLSEVGECHAIASDLSTVDGIVSFTEALQAKEDHLHILVNNAGATWGAALEEFPEKGWDKVVDLNLKSPFFLLQHLLPLLSTASSKEDPARVINIASVNGMTYSQMENYSYTASKSGLIHLTRHLAAQLAQKQITVNAISPGFFPSDMTKFLDADQLAQMIPLKRIGNEKDAAGVALFLCSRASSWVTGVNIPLDGGIVAAS